MFADLLLEGARVEEQRAGQAPQNIPVLLAHEEVLAMAEEVEPMFPHVIRKELIEQADSFRNYLCGL